MELKSCFIIVYIQMSLKFGSSCNEGYAIESDIEEDEGGSSVKDPVPK